MENVSENLEGFGNVDTNKSDGEEGLNEDPIEFNETKRKRLGESLQESFQHPKLIKTDKISFGSQLPKIPAEKSKKTSTKLKIEPLKKTDSSKDSKITKHKFQVIN